MVRERTSSGSGFPHTLQIFGFFFYLQLPSPPAAQHLILLSLAPWLTTRRSIAPFSISRLASVKPTSSLLCFFSLSLLSFCLPLSVSFFYIYSSSMQLHPQLFLLCHRTGLASFFHILSSFSFTCPSVAFSSSFPCPFFLLMLHLPGNFTELCSFPLSSESISPCDFDWSLSTKYFSAPFCPPYFFDRSARWSRKERVFQGWARGRWGTGKLYTLNSIAKALLIVFLPFRHSEFSFISRILQQPPCASSIPPRIICGV